MMAEKIIEIIAIINGQNRSSWLIVINHGQEHGSVWVTVGYRCCCAIFWVTAFPRYTFCITRSWDELLNLSEIPSFWVDLLSLNDWNLTISKCVPSVANESTLEVYITICEQTVTNPYWYWYIQQRIVLSSILALPYHSHQWYWWNLRWFCTHPRVFLLIIRIIPFFSLI